ncbi:hypothetical protein PFICI_00879 [Pestalotiopsis fici W106-1]|uniref:DUF7053 domain-containing protein n=1 Tax=Pestalotiopsis fici (strain W106-1 / CGMCC3.15140) TaxID=1229662 RepID=W3XP45_PESFW|nr:uncharacterized protein PFICI_00879 [Pestalotiopsis fici W106-1]ETS87051.1 hypothetical protein PFICI_00879 [Pestalotiopsis fici W106-1]
MSFLNTTANLRNTTPIPLPPSKRQGAVALLHDHDFYLHCDPHLTDYKAVEAPTNPAPTFASYKVPAPVSALAGANPTVKLYEVHDHVPNPVYSSNVKSNEEMVDFADGLWVRVRSPMGVMMETTWTVRERTDNKTQEEGGGGENAAADDSGLELVEEVYVSCNRMLMGLVKSSVEANWQKIHDKIVSRMVEDAGKATSS